nr:formamidopyrimidine-DNA glycosylase [Streptococcus thermophilus]
MPELPEVEVVRRGLDTHIVGSTFDAIEVLHPRAVRGNDVDLTEILPGLSVTGTGRRGKFMWLELSDGAALMVHLRMSGQMIVGEPGLVDSPHLRIRALMHGESSAPLELDFIDQRTFGSWQYTQLIGGIPAAIPHIAPDPFEPDFDSVATARAIRKKNVAIKTVLLDQSVVSGIGSIYADEAMWAAGIKPTRKGRALRQRDAVRLLEESRAVMARALEAGGTSFDSLYVNVNGASGYFSRSLNAYGQADEPCARCGTPIARTVVNGRSSYFCPSCQVL